MLEKLACLMQYDSSVELRESVAHARRAIRDAYDEVLQELMSAET